MFSDFNPANKAITRTDITRITGFNPVNVAYYQQAFIHKSVLRFITDPELSSSYERYEFLGDSVLNLIVAIRTKLVNGKTLAYLAGCLKLNEFLIISKNVESINGRSNDRILEDIFEAFLCSIHSDLGFKYVENFVLRVINEFIDFNTIEEDNNFKDILLRKCQQSIQVNPEYELISTTGPAHKKTFTSVVVIKGVHYATGTGNTKKESEQAASRATLAVLTF